MWKQLNLGCMARPGWGGPHDTRNRVGNSPFQGCLGPAARVGLKKPGSMQSRAKSGLCYVWGRAECFLPWARPGDCRARGPGLEKPRSPRQRQRESCLQARLLPGVQETATGSPALPAACSAPHPCPACGGSTRPGVGPLRQSQAEPSRPEDLRM